MVPVARIRPEEGLGRKRDREGHQELCQSIARFGVLTPVLVRPAQDGTGDYLLVKGQGRTLACQMLRLDEIPAIVVDEDIAEDEKVQQFLVENVARLRMRSVDRALLIARARQDGEETADVARRFGVTAATVRRLQSQLEGASRQEVAVMRKGNVNLTLHAVVARHVDAVERGDVLEVLASHSLKAKEVDTLFQALGWAEMAALGSKFRKDRLLLLHWACAKLAGMSRAPAGDRLTALAAELPMKLDVSVASVAAGG